MSHPYKLKPACILTRLTVADETFESYCAGFELSEWRCDGLADNLMEWITDYALKSDELRNSNHTNNYVRLKQAATRVYISENYKRRGEVGEIAAHAICRTYFDTIPIAARVNYLSASNDPVKAFDFVHVRYVNGGDIELWLKEVCDVFCEPQKVGAFGAYNTRQLATLINKLRQGSSFKGFLLTQDASYPGKPEDQDNIFKFLRACEYGLPQNFALVELFVRQVAPKADYSLFLGSVASWFRPEVLKELDEEGVPIQISERYYVEGDDKPKLRARLLNECQSSTSQLSDFEREWLQQAI